MVELDAVNTYVKRYYLLLLMLLWSGESCVWICLAVCDRKSSVRTDTESSSCNVHIAYSIFCSITSLNGSLFLSHSLGSEWSLCCHGDSRRVGFSESSRAAIFCVRELTMHENTRLFHIVLFNLLSLSSSLLDHGVCGARPPHDHWAPITRPAVELPRDPLNLTEMYTKWTSFMCAHIY